MVANSCHDHVVSSINFCVFLYLKFYEANFHVIKCNYSVMVSCFFRECHYL